MPSDLGSDQSKCNATIASLSGHGKPARCWLTPALLYLASLIVGVFPMTAVEASKGNDGVEIEVLELLGKLTGLQASWQMKEQLLSRLSIMLQQHGQETEEAILCARPAAVIDSIMAFMVSGRIQPSSKLLAADVLSTICSNTKAYLLLCPSSVVERLMRCAYKGDADVKAAAARALWQLSCHNDFSPEVGVILIHSKSVHEPLHMLINYECCSSWSTLLECACKECSA